MSGKHRRNESHLVRNSTILTGAIALGVSTLNPIANSADEEVWDRVAQCESSNNWSINSGNGYSGGLQFLDSTWDGFGGNEFADTAYKATKSEQIQVAERVLKVQGWNAWPVCSKKANATSEPAKPKPKVSENTQAEATIEIPKQSQMDSHTVISGDILSVIAAEYSEESWQDLARINNLDNPDLIYPGDVIKLR